MHYETGPAADHVTPRVLAARSGKVQALLRVRYVIALGGILIAAGGLAACASGMPVGTVIEVEHHAISGATVDHWVRVEGVISQQAIPRQPVPAGLVPDAPKYAACIIYLKASGPRGGEGTNSGVAEFRRECEKRYEVLRRHVLSLLITFQWLTEEGARRSIRVTDGEVARQLARFKSEHFTSEAEFRKYLAYTNQTLADELLVLRIDLLVIKFQQRLAAKGGPSAIARFSQELPKRWVPRTSCRRGFIMSDCKQYKGPLAPEVGT